MEDYIILETHNGGDRLCFSKEEYTLAESRDFIKLLPVDEKKEPRALLKPFWKVVKS